jgi:protein-tyrosine phosphatase
MTSALGGMAITDLNGRARRLLVICSGNICRSPAAEAVLRALAGSSIEVRSRATDSWNIGQPAHAPMVRLAAARGYDLRAHRSIRVSEADLRWADEVLVMQPVHHARLARAFPGHAGKVRLLHPDGVPDPYDLDDVRYAEVLDLIETAARAYLDGAGEPDGRPRHER